MKYFIDLLLRLAIYYLELLYLFRTKEITSLLYIGLTHEYRSQHYSFLNKLV